MVNSSFIYFPCIPVSESKDLVHWRIIGYAITNPEWAALDNLEGGRGYWAPDISYHNSCLPAEQLQFFSLPSLPHTS